MPLFAKFLAFMNVVAAGLFLYLAAQDWNARQPWAYEVFLSEIALDGLPIDETDPGLRRVDMPLHPDLDDTATLQDVFKHAAVKGEKSPAPVATQKAEVERRKKEIADELGKLGDDDKRKALKSYLLPLAHSLEERVFWAERIKDDKDVPTKELEADFLEFFDRAVSDKVGPEKHDVGAAKLEKDTGKKTVLEQTPNSRRQRIAHLLYNLSPDVKNHQRVLVVVGLRSYVNEAEGQAARLREMSQRTRLAMIDERAHFEVEYDRLVQRIVTLAEDVFQRQIVLQDKEKLKERSQALVNIRKKDVVVLQNQLDAAKKQVEQARQTQGELEKQLFDAQKALGDLKEKAETLTRTVKGLERR